MLLNSKHMYTMDLYSYLFLVGASKVTHICGYLDLCGTTGERNTAVVGRIEREILPDFRLIAPPYKFENTLTTAPTNRLNVLILTTLVDPVDCGGMKRYLTGNCCWFTIDSFLFVLPANALWSNGGGELAKIIFAHV